MKKFIFALLILIILLSLVACNKESESVLDNIPSDEATSSESENASIEYDSHPIRYYSKDLDVFIQNVTTVIGDMREESILAKGETKKEPVPIPEILSEDFVFVSAEDMPSSFKFYYNSTKQGSEHFWYSDGICVTVNKLATSFEETMSHYNLPIKDGIAYEEASNQIHINFNGRLVSIDFPDSDSFVKIDTREKVSEYFKFDDQQISTGEKIN